MAVLRMAVKREYFEQIKSGNKKEEFRLVNDYWENRLIGNWFSQIQITLGYPKNDDESRILYFPYSGYEIKTITHKHFGENPVEVFAIKLGEQNEK